jgi:sulfide dehydrogenase cytochrome subunit
VIGPVTAVMVAASILPWIGSAMAAGLADAPPGALSCSGCHANSRGGNATMPRLASRDANAVVAAMQAFRSGQTPSTVMDRIAKGFTDSEIEAIAAWYAVQKD